jgi:uncharacterized membrane protein (UPF0127 family)
MKRLAYLFILILLITVFVSLVSDNKKYVLSVDSKIINTIVVDNHITRTKGLSGMQSLPKDTVMLFVFDKPDTYGIWMKDMRFPIDIIWLDEDGRIVWLENNVSPLTYPKVFFPPKDSLYTIEAKPGFIEQNHLVVGKILSVSAN